MEDLSARLLPYPQRCRLEPSSNTGLSRPCRNRHAAIEQHSEVAPRFESIKRLWCFGRSPNTPPDSAFWPQSRPTIRQQLWLRFNARARTSKRMGSPSHAAIMAYISAIQCWILSGRNWTAAVLQSLFIPTHMHHQCLDARRPWSRWLSRRVGRSSRCSTLDTCKDIRASTSLFHTGGGSLPVLASRLELLGAEPWVPNALGITTR